MTLQHGRTQNAGADIDILSAQRIRTDLPNVCTALLAACPGIEGVRVFSTREVFTWHNHARPISFF
jgi:hypothetical protein